MHGKVCFLREYIEKDVKMLRRVKIMLHVVREKNYWLLIINLLAELKKRLKISIFLWRKSCASR